MPPKAPRISEDFIPIGEFKTHASKFLRRLKARGRPLVITQHGRAAAVLMEPGDYDEFGEREAFMAHVRHGLAAAEQGDFVSDEEIEKELDTLFGSAPKKPKR